MRDFPLAKMHSFFVACMDTGKEREQEAVSFEYFANSPLLPTGRR